MTVRRPPKIVKAGARAKKKQTTTKRKPLGPTAAAGKERYQTSYGNPLSTNANVLGVQGEVKDMSREQRLKFFRQVERNTRRDQTQFGLTAGGTGTAKDIPGLLYQNLIGALPSQQKLRAGGGSASKATKATSSSGRKVAPWENLDAPTGTLLLGKPEKEEGAGGKGKPKKPKKGKGKGSRGGRSRQGRKGQTVRTNKPRGKK